MQRMKVKGIVALRDNLRSVTINIAGPTPDSGEPYQVVLMFTSPTPEIEAGTEVTMTIREVVVATATDEAASE